MRILILEDNPADAELLERQLKKAGISCACEQVKTKAAYQLALKKFLPDAILADHRLPRFDALQALALRNKTAPLTPFIVITGSVSEEVAVACMKQGADDYLLKDRLARLGEAIQHSVTNYRLKLEKATTEESLRKSEERFRSLYENATIGIYRTTPEGRILMANPSLLQMLGYEDFADLARRDLESNGFEEGFARSDFRCQVEAQGQVIGHESAWKRHDGTTVFIRESARAIRDAGGRTIFYEGTVEDISTRRQAEDALREMNEIFRLFLKHNPIYVFIKDENIRPVYLSENYEKMLGRPLDEILGKNMDELFPSALSRSMIEDDKTILREGKPREFIETLGGRTFSTLKFPIFIQGKAKFLAGYTTDITERMLAEETLQASLHEKEVLLKEIHHRVKNNLQVISGLLALQAGQIDDKRLQRMIKESQDRIWTMALIHQTLYQSGNLAAIDMADYIRSLAGNLLSSHARVAMPPTVHFDLLPVQLVIDKAIPLALIINELLTNSLKHAFPDGRQGEISITLHENTAARTAPHSAAYDLVVADDGAGLAAGFDPVMQKSLGLQLVAMLAKQLDGTMAITASGGTTVRITFAIDEKNKRQS